MRQESKGGFRKYSLAAAVVTASAAALASFTFSICPPCDRPYRIPIEQEKPKDLEEAPKPNPEASRHWKTTLS